MRWYHTLASRIAAGEHAVFDADGTLWDGNVGEAFMYVLAAEGVLPATTGDEYARLFEKSYDLAYAFATRCLAGHPEAWVQERSRAFFASAWSSRIFPEMRALLEHLALRGVLSWVASASNRWIIQAGAAELEVPAERVIGMSLEVDGGILSDRLVRPLVNGAGKAEALRQRLPQLPALAGGNSVNDLAMLRLATTDALVVSPEAGPDPRTGEDLRAEAVARGWMIRDLRL
jgi:phosphoserine phosphatase